MIRCRGASRSKGVSGSRRVSRSGWVSRGAGGGRQVRRGASRCGEWMWRDKRKGEQMQRGKQGYGRCRHYSSSTVSHMIVPCGAISLVTSWPERG